MKAMYGVVLLCTEGMAICEDDWEDLWCAEMPEEFVTEGDGIEIDGLTPLEDLPIEQQTRIKNELTHYQKNIWMFCVITEEKKNLTCLEIQEPAILPVFLLFNLIGIIMKPMRSERL